MAVRKVGTSRIVREIGRGGMGVVYEGYQEALDRRVAVKALDATQAKNRELVERFQREGRAYAQIHHPGIVAVYDLVEKDDAYYLVTEFVHGSDVCRILENGGALPPACVAAVGARVADALDCAHARALLHRDVKPSNVMVSREGEVKLLDFGVAKDSLSTSLTKTGVVVGTLAYLAPEVLGGGPATAASDVWSLGVALYEMATGRRPFEGTGHKEVVAAVCRGRFQAVRAVVPGFPRRLARAVERCLARDPARRWVTAGALARELELHAAHLSGRGVRGQDLLVALLEARGLGGEASAASKAVRSFGLRLRRAAWATLVAALAVAAVYAWWFSPWHPSW
ncbi:MAG TPA: serine/threonine-protein kinase [Anaeromyxobacteraceae bacterium]|nr:serine/threonine-protein kinase [Anaeromyxobacteraceae bacterium]